MSDAGETKSGETKSGASKSGAAAGRSQPVDPKLLELLVCPVSHKTLRFDKEAGELISEAAGLAYPIRDGIPIMLEDEARRLDDTP